MSSLHAGDLVEIHSNFKNRDVSSLILNHWPAANSWNGGGRPLKFCSENVPPSFCSRPFLLVAISAEETYSLVAVLHDNRVFYFSVCSRHLQKFTSTGDD